MLAFGLGACLGSAPRSPNAVDANPALFNRETYRYVLALRARNEAERYSVMVLQANDSRLVPILHRGNPHLKIFVYQDIAVARATDLQGLTVCTLLRPDLAAAPDWFLKDLSGRRITYGDNYLMDVGSTGYQQACVAHAIALAKRLGFDGIFLDGVGAALDYELPPTARPRSLAYPTIASWQTAMYSMLSYAGQAMHAHGLLVIGNIGGAVLTPGLWQRWNAPLDGAEEESWTDGGAGLAQQIPSWPEKLGNVAWSEAHNKYAVLHSYNPTEAGNTYGLASMLLVAGGHSSYSTSNTSPISYEAWYPEYDAARRLGVPKGAYIRRHNGVYERVFTNGVVLVNPSTDVVPRFSLGGGRFSGSGPGDVSAVSMGATSGLILTNA